MLPLEPWLAAMNIESQLPQRPPQPSHTTSGHGSLRRVVGRGLIALGVALGGADSAGRTVSVGR
jgi:hypothetical protein